MQLYFIRHGQSSNNALWARTGTDAGRDSDPELTAIGVQQSKLLAQFLLRSNPAIAANGPDSQNLAGFGLTHLYTSLMVRAVATGTIIADALGLPLVAWEDLHEAGGIYLKDEQTGELVGQAGKDRAYFEVHYPRLILPDSLGEEGWWNRPFEEREQRPIRARRFLHDLMERHGRTDDRVAVISHGGFYNHLLAAIFQLPPESNCRFVINNAAITRIDFSDERINVVYMNRAEFLPPELVT